MIIPVILCGGAGTRLWPASRPHAPKPFLRLIDGKSTFALTLERIAESRLFAKPLVVAGAQHGHLVDDALATVGAEATVMLEPVARDTAPAIAAAAAHAAQGDAHALLLVLPADHVIRATAAFAADVSAASAAADAGRIVTFGIQPDRAATEYGYIRPGEAVAGGTVRAVDRFIEKPDAARASELVADGCLWNGGIFLMRVDVAVAELEKHAPDIMSAARAAVDGASEEGRTLLAKEAFAAAPRLSFDYAVMEKTDAAAVAEATFDWSDVGTWAAVWGASSKDADGNAVSGDAVVLDSRQSYVSTVRPRVGVVGLDGVVVVASDDAVLVAGRSRADEIKQLVKAIDAAPEANIGDFVRHYRPWGHYQSLDLGGRHQVKRIVVDPGQRLSLQKHAHRAEHWTVVEGTAEVTVGMTPQTLAVTDVPANQSVHIPQGAIHRLANRGSVPVVLIEVQVGDYVGEDDIVRLEDDYGRIEG